MHSQAFALCSWLLVTPPPIESKLEQLVPLPISMIDKSHRPHRRNEITRAVILIHGLRVQPVSAAAVHRAEPSLWEMPQAPLVQALSKDNDVYGYHYAQTTSVDDVARLASLARAVGGLQEAGYSEIVLVGFSAGGIIARQFVEDQPAGGGVTKVVQVCTPNNGSDWTILTQGVRAAQIPFIESLKRETRVGIARQRADRQIPDSVQFVSLVTVSNWVGDGVVRRDSQWPSELQLQGIPAETIFRSHVGAMYSTRLSSKVAQLVTSPQPRWNEEQVKAARTKVLGLMSLAGGQ